MEIEDNKDKNIIKWGINPNNNEEIREKDISKIKINWGFNNQKDNQDNEKKIEQNLSEKQNPLFQVPKQLIMSQYLQILNLDWITIIQQIKKKIYKIKMN